MIKKIGFTIVGIMFLGVYISISIKLFSGSGSDVQYVKNELMFGSDTLLGGFIFMTLILLIICNKFIDSFFKNKRGQ